MDKVIYELTIRTQFEQINELCEQIDKLQEKLKVSQTNEETYRLEMQDITKILGLDEHTIFDDVKLEIENIIKEKQERKQIIDKAIEYINKELEKLPHYLYEKEIYDVLDILRGNDE